jgi:hypothetical protein
METGQMKIKAGFRDLLAFPVAMLGLGMIYLAICIGNSWTAVVINEKVFNAEVK